MPIWSFWWRCVKLWAIHFSPCTVYQARHTIRRNQVSSSMRGLKTLWKIISRPGFFDVENITLIHNEKFTSDCKDHCQQPKAAVRYYWLYWLGTWFRVLIVLLATYPVPQRFCSMYRNQDILKSFYKVFSTTLTMHKTEGMSTFRLRLRFWPLSFTYPGLTLMRKVYKITI